MMDVPASKMSQAALKALKAQGRAPNALRPLYRTLEVEPNNPQGLLVLSELFRGRPNGNRPSGEDIYSGIIIEYAMDPKTFLPVTYKPIFERERTVIMAAWGFASQRGTEVDLDHIGYMTYINSLMSQVGSVYKGFSAALKKLGVQAGAIESATGKHTRVYDEWLKSSNANLQV
jgi:hypothetical protein